MNCVSCTGRINSDIKISKREVGDMKYVFANFQLAMKRPYMNDKKLVYDYVWCEAYQKQAEFIEKFMSKGVRIAVSGWIKSEYYTNRNGSKGYSFKISIEKIEIADARQNENDVDSGGYILSNVDLSGLEGAEYLTENPNI